jgi:hypothetical protein
MLHVERNRPLRQLLPASRMTRKEQGKKKETCTTHRIEYY